MLVRPTALARGLRRRLSGGGGAARAAPLPAGPRAVPFFCVSCPSSPRSTSSSSSSGPRHRSPVSPRPAQATEPSPEDAGALVASCLDAPNRERCRRELASRGRPAWLAASGTQRVNAAVLVSLCRRRDGEPSVLLTLRSRTIVGRHSGDVCFPGGKQEEGDQDAVETALREAREELGVDVSGDCVWGLLTPVPDVTDKMMVWPVLADLGEIDAGTLNPNPDEVEEAFLVSLRHLCQPAHQGYTRFRAKGGRYAYTLPLFSTGHSLRGAAVAVTVTASAPSSAPSCGSSAWGSHRVWGLTAVLVDQALSVLLPGVYSSKLQGKRFSRPSGGKGQTRVTQTDQ